MVSLEAIELKSTSEVIPVNSSLYTMTAHIFCFRNIHSVDLSHKQKEKHISVKAIHCWAQK